MDLTINSVEELNSEGVVALRNAIVESAAKELLELKQIVYSDMNRDFGLTTTAMQINLLEKWFLSRHFEILNMKHSGAWFIKQIDEFAKESVEEQFQEKLSEQIAMIEHQQNLNRNRRKLR